MNAKIFITVCDYQKRINNQKLAFFAFICGLFFYLLNFKVPDRGSVNPPASGGDLVFAPSPPRGEKAGMRGDQFEADS